MFGARPHKSDPSVNRKTQIKKMRICPNCSASFPAIGSITVWVSAYDVSVQPASTRLACRSSINVGKATATIVPSIEDINRLRAASPKKIQRRSSDRAGNEGIDTSLQAAWDVVVAQPDGTV